MPPAVRWKNSTQRVLLAGRAGHGVATGLADHEDTAVAGLLEVDVVVGDLGVAHLVQGRQLLERPAPRQRRIGHAGIRHREVEAVVGAQSRAGIVLVAPGDADLGAERDDARDVAIDQAVRVDRVAGLRGELRRGGPVDAVIVGIAVHDGRALRPDDPQAIARVLLDRHGIRTAAECRRGCARRPGDRLDAGRPMGVRPGRIRVLEEPDVVRRGRHRERRRRVDGRRPRRRRGCSPPWSHR